MEFFFYIESVSTSIIFWYGETYPIRNRVVINQMLNSFLKTYSISEKCDPNSETFGETGDPRLGTHLLGGT